MAWPTDYASKQSMSMCFIYKIYMLADVIYNSTVSIPTSCSGDYIAFNREYNTPSYLKHVEILYSYSSNSIRYIYLHDICNNFIICSYIATNPPYTPTNAYNLYTIIYHTHSWTLLHVSVINLHSLGDIILVPRHIESTHPIVHIQC
jgi:hypothetical protein